MSDSNNNLISTTPINMALDLPANAPYVPSVAEAKHYLHGLPSNLTGRFIARSSPDVWTKPTGPEAYLEPKELSPLGTHQLNSIIWEHTVGPAMDAYLSKKLVQCTVLLPVCIGPVGKPLSPVIMVGVNHNTLSPTIGIDVAIGCRSILLRNGIDDMHIIIHESTFHYFASLYKPAITSNPTHLVREPFSTTLGIPICNAATPNIEGTGSFFFTDSANPNILYLLTARHVLFPPETSENKLYTYRKGNGQPKKQVMFMGEATFKNHCRDIELAIDGKNIIIAQLKRRLADADKLDDKEEAMEERKQAEDGIEMAKNAIEVFQKLLATIIRDWMLEENRVIGHIVLSPPIAPNYGKDGFTDDWAVIQINPSMIDRLNFIVMTHSFTHPIIYSFRLGITHILTYMHPEYSNSEVSRRSGHCWT